MTAPGEELVCGSLTVSPTSVRSVNIVGSLLFALLPGFVQAFFRFAPGSGRASDYIDHSQIYNNIFPAPFLLQGRANCSIAGDAVIACQLSQWYNRWQPNTRERRQRVG